MTNDKICEPAIPKSIQTIADFLWQERTDKLKDFVLNSLTANIEESIHNHWLVLPSTVDDLWNDMIDEIRDELYAKYKSKVKKCMQAELEEFISNMCKGDKT